MEPRGQPTRESKAVLTGSGSTRRLTVPLLGSVQNLLHAFTVAGSDPTAVLEDGMGSPAAMHILRQRHGATVHRVAARERTALEAVPPEGDALITDRRGVAIAVQVADCVPILACGAQSGALAAVHAGWRGTIVGVLTNTIRALETHYRLRPHDLRIVLGPAIGPCCFEVGEEVVEALLRSDPGATGCVVPGRPRQRIDLIEANRRQAIAAGVPADAIQSTDLCTVCHPDLLLSYRRSGGGAGRMAGLIAWRN